MSDELSAVVLFEPPGDVDVRGVAAALTRELAALEPAEPEPAGAIALPVPDHARLDHAALAIALDPASAARARAAGVARVVLLAPRFDPELLELEVEVDLVLAPHEELAAEAVRRGLEARVCGPVAPDGWSPGDRAALRDELSLGADARWVVVRAGALEDDPAAALVQLSLVRAACVWLFDVGDDAALARRLRERVPGYGLDAVMFADGPDALRCYRAADAVLGALSGPEAVRALATGASLVTIPPAAGALRLAHALEVERIAEVADAPATLAVSLDRALESAALAAAREVGARLEAEQGARRAVELVRQLVRGELSAAASGLPSGIERLSDGETKPERPQPQADLDASVDAELAALRKKLGL